jgi:hypothetical protein
MGGGSYRCEGGESTGLVFGESVHGSSRLLDRCFEKGKRFWPGCADLQSRNPAYVARALSLVSGSTSLDQTSAMDVDMASTLSSTERDAALTKLFGQSALIETLLAEDGESNYPLILADS